MPPLPVRRGIAARSLIFWLLVIAIGLVALTEWRAARTLRPRNSATLPALDWPSYGGDRGAMRYSPVPDLTPANVGRLRIAWTWKTGESQVQSVRGEPLAFPLQFEATPLVLGDTLYVVTPLHQVAALDAVSGRQLWRFDPDTWRRAGVPTRVPVTHRGVAVWTGQAQRRVLLATGRHLFALDARTGTPIPSFGDSGKVDITADFPSPADPAHFGNTSPPALFDSLVIVGSSISDGVTYPGDPPGLVQAYHVLTGKRVWSWSPIPRAGEPGSETWPPEVLAMMGHTNVWAPITVDAKRGLVFLPVSTPSNDWYGGGRVGDNLFAESLVCLDAKTGIKRWHFQIVHHGVWDYDPASEPTLIRVQRDGRDVDAVALAGKTGFVYAFERETGMPLWPIEERPVPVSDVPGEQVSSTQPFPTKPRPFARQGLSEADLADFTPEVAALARAAVQDYRFGPLFTPPSLSGTLVSPGWIGGAGWGSVAFDPTTTTLYVKATNRVTLARLVPIPPHGRNLVGRFAIEPSLTRRSSLSFQLPGQRRAFLPDLPAIDVPVGKPPYGTLTAIDMNTGEHRWQVTVGDMPAIRNHPMLAGVNLLPLGVPGSPGAVVTAGGLLFLASGGRVLYALDRSSGATLWSHDLRREAYSVPAVYRASTGQSFVVIAAGSGSDARLIAFRMDRP